MLFTLGCWYDEARKKVKVPLNISIQKVDFVKIIRKGKFAEKGQRAVYKNLETLEKNKYVSYDKKELKLTIKGLKEYKKIKKEIIPFIHTMHLLKQKNPLSYPERIQSRFCS